MIIDAPKQTLIPDLRSLWREAFGDTEEFLDGFFKTAFHTDRCRCAVSDESVTAVLYWFDCLHMGKRIAYVYAVATAKAYRGRGISHALMEDTHRHLERLGYEGVILVPGSETLFRFYEGMGYRTCSTIREFSCASAVKEIEVRCIDKKEYALLRRRMLPVGGIVQENENLDFLQTQALFYSGSGFLLAARKEADRLVGVELLGDEGKAPAIVNALGCVRGMFRVPGEGRPFAMYRSLSGNVSAHPSYFGLAFD